jgi:hypothetical protein
MPSTSVKTPRAASAGTIRFHSRRASFDNQRGATGVLATASDVLFARLFRGFAPIISRYFSLVWFNFCSFQRE